MKEIIIEVPDRFGKTLMPEKANSKIKGQIVRCKDCKHGKQLFVDYISCQISEENESGCHVMHKPDWFCADGEQARMTVDGAEVVLIRSEGKEEQ